MKNKIGSKMFKKNIILALIVVLTCNCTFIYY